MLGRYLFLRQLLHSAILHLQRRISSHRYRLRNLPAIDPLAGNPFFAGFIEFGNHARWRQLNVRRAIPDSALKAMTRKPVMRRLIGVIRDEQGSQLVEFAVSIMVLLMAILGIFGFCLAIYSYQFVAYAAESGARYAMVRGADWKTSCNTSAPPHFSLSYGCIVGTDDVQNYVRNIAIPGINASSITVNTTWPGTTPNCTSNCSVCTNTKSQGCFVKVQVTYPFQFLLPFLPASTFSLASTSEKVIQE